MWYGWRGFFLGHCPLTAAFGRAPAYDVGRSGKRPRVPDAMREIVPKNNPIYAPPVYSRIYYCAIP